MFSPTRNFKFLREKNYLSRLPCANQGFVYVYSIYDRIVCLLNDDHPERHITDTANNQKITKYQSEQIIISASDRSRVSLNHIIIINEHVQIET